MNFATFVPNGPIKRGVIWLSGLTCNEENFISKAGAQKALSDAQTVVIAPDTSPRGLDLPGEHEQYDFGSGAGFYVDATLGEYAGHYRMYSHIVHEIYPMFKRDYGVDQVSIMGHSMGGHGAMVIGLRNPSLFTKIAAFAPIVNPSQVPWGTKAFTGYLADRKSWDAYDACELIKSSHRHPETIVIYQGTDDEFLETQLKVKRFEEVAAAAGQKVDVRWCDGYDHGYYFIQTFIGEGLQV
jgi:S-formylglutathione hydrolase